MKAVLLNNETLADANRAGPHEDAREELRSRSSANGGMHGGMEVVLEATLPSFVDQVVEAVSWAKAAQVWQRSTACAKPIGS